MRHVAVGLALLCLLAGCQPPQQKPTVSLEQAKQITADFAPSGFVAPPRTITDITAVLDEYKPDPVKAAADRALADQAPPAGASDSELAAFYHQRGVAAGNIGRVPQQLADLRRAYELATAAHAEPTRILQDLMTAEALAGNNANAIRYGEMRWQNDQRVDGFYATQVVTAGRIARFNIARGNLAEAERWQGQQRTASDVVLSHPKQAIYRPGILAAIADTEGDLLAARGRYAEAEEKYREAWRGHGESLRTLPYWAGARTHGGVPNPSIFELARDTTLTAVAAMLREQGRPIEAEVEARRALISTLKRVGRYNPQTALRLDELAAVLLDQGRDADAEHLARAALGILATVGADHSWSVAHARLTLAAALVAESRWTDALASYDAMLQDLAGDEAGRQRFGFGNSDWAIALIAAGRAPAAVDMAERLLGRERAARGEQHYATAEAHAVLAMALARTGARERALDEFRTALPVLLSAQDNGGETDKSAKAQRLRLILDAYIRLLAEIRATPLEASARIDAAAAAFQLADAARGHAVQKALSAANARSAIRDPALADLARRAQDAAEQVAGLEATLVNALAAPADQQDGAGVAALRGRIDQLRQAHAALVREIETRFPAYAQLVDPKPATVAEARAVLRPDEALVTTYTVEDATYVWAVGPSGPVAFAAVPLGAAALADAVKALRRALDPQVDRLGDIPPFDVARAGQLYDALLKPVEPGWKGAASLLVVPDKSLAQLPLGVLVTRPTAPPRDPAGAVLFASYRTVPFLARQVAITQLPSVAALASLRALPPAAEARKPFVGFGDPAFTAQQAAAPQVAALPEGTQMRGGGRLAFRSAPTTERLASAELAQLPPLPDTAEEVRSIARALKADPDKDVFIGAAANEHTVETMDLADRRVIAFATHGLVPGDLNGLSEPALALAAPQVSGGGGDGLLTMDEVLGLKLDADWVVLSACNTAAGDGAGAEAVSGLGRAFFYAGARALLVSNWPVETTSARKLTTDLFRRQAADAHLSRAQALRQAELALIDGDFKDAGGKDVFSYAHPIFWAPFSLVGDGAGVR